MMKKKLFRDRQEARAGDFNEPQDFTQNSFDTLVADAITDDARYKGMSVTHVSGTEVAISAGRLYDGGRMYDRTVSTNKSLIADLPVSQKRIVTVVAFGQTLETEVEPRDFLIDLETGTTEPQAVAMTEIRRAEIGFLTSSESVSPAPPAVAAGQVKVADIVLNPTGVVSIKMSAETELGGLEGANSDIRQLETFRARIKPRVDTLEATLADVRDRLSTRASQDALAGIAGALVATRREAGLPSATLNWGFDDFADDARTDDTVAGDEAYRIISEALNFPDGGIETAVLDLFNTNESAAKKTTQGLMLPSHENKIALGTDDPIGDIALSSFTVNGFETRTYTTTRKVTRTGSRRGQLKSYTFNKGSGWAKGSTTVGADLLHRNLNKSGRSFDEHVDYLEDAFGTDVQVRRNYDTEKYSYTESVPVTRRRRVSTTETVTGMTLMQTVLVPRMMWLTEVGLNFTSLDSSGDVTVIVSSTDGSGMPNKEEVHSKVTVAHADLVAGGETAVTLEPVLLEAGESIAIWIVTNGSHRHATVQGVEDFQGSIMFGDSTGTKHTEDGKSLHMSLYAAHFSRVRTEVRLQDVTLSGGITDLQIDTEEVAPDGTSVDYEYQHNGVWYSLSDATALIANTPSTVPMRVVFSGTTTVQPAVQTGADRIEATISGTSLTHYSTVRNLPAASSEVYVDLFVFFFDPANETVTASLLDADNALAAISADSSEVISDQTINDKDGVDTGMVNRIIRFAFTPTAIENYHIKIEGSTAAAADRPFAISERTDSAV